MNEEIHHLNAEEYQILNNVETFQTSPSLIDRISVNNEEGEILSDLEDDSLHSTHIPTNKIDTSISKEEKGAEGSFKPSLRNFVNEKTAADCNQSDVAADGQDGALEEGELSDTPVGDEASAKSNICRYFSRFGSCNRGNQCKFLHIHPSSNTNQNHPGRIIITSNIKSTLLSTTPVVVTSCCVRDSNTAVDTVAGGNVPQSNQNNGGITVADSNVESSNIKGGGLETPQNSHDKGKGETLINITTRGGAASAWERGLAQAKKLNSAKRQAVSSDVSMTTSTADVLAVKEERYHGNNHQEVGRTKLAPARYRQLLDHKEGDGDDYEREYSLHPPYPHFGRNYGPSFILPPPRHLGVTRGPGPPPYYYPPPPRPANWGHPPPLYPPPHHRRTFTGPYDTYVPPPPPPLLSNNYYPDIYLDMVEGKERGRESPMLVHSPAGVDLRDHLVWRRRRRRYFNDNAEETADLKAADAVTDQLSALSSTPSSSDDDEFLTKTRNSSHENSKLPQTDDQSVGKRNKPDDEWHDPWARDRGTKTNRVTHQRRYFDSAEIIQNDELNNSSDRVSVSKNQKNVEKQTFPTDKSGRRYQQHDTALSSDYYNYHYSNYSRYPPSHHDRSHHHYDSTFDTNSTRNDILSHTNSNKRIKSAVVRAANIHKENSDDNFLQDNKRSYPKKRNKSSSVSSNSSNTTSQTSTRSSSSSTTSSSCSEKSSAKSTINTTQNEKYAPCSADHDAISSGSATSNSSNSSSKFSLDHINSLDNKSRKSFKLDNHLRKSKTNEKTDVLNIKSAPLPVQKNGNESKSKIPKAGQHSGANKKENEMSDISSDNQFSDAETNSKSHRPTQKMHKTKDLNQKDIKNGESQLIPKANIVKHPSESDLESISSDDSLENESFSDKKAAKKANNPRLLLIDNENVKSSIIQKKKPNSNYDNTINVNQSKRYSNDKNEQEMKFNKEDGSKTIKKNINIVSKNSNDKNARREQLLKELKEVEMAIAKKLGK